MDPAANATPGYGAAATGNLAGGPGFGAGYDVQNRLPTFVPTSAGTEYYSYGPDNMRVWKKRPAAGEEVYFYGAQGEELGGSTTVPECLPRRGAACTSELA